jgi:hypothetical protein
MLLRSYKYSVWNSDILKGRSNFSGNAPTTYSTLWSIVFINKVSHFQHGKCFHVFRAMSAEAVTILWHNILL